MHINGYRFWCERSDPPLPADFIPAMARRRLSKVARSMLTMMHELAAGDDAPVVYCSRHGDSDRVVNVLFDVAREEPLSPMGFSLSVHNALMGQWSIANASQSPMVAVSSGGRGYDGVFIEADGFLQQGYEAVLVVMHASPMAPVYRENLAQSDVAGLPDWSRIIVLRLDKTLGDGSDLLTMDWCPHKKQTLCTAEAFDSLWRGLQKEKPGFDLGGWRFANSAA